MGVEVDETGRDNQIGRIEDIGVRRGFDSFTERGHAAVFDEQVHAFVETLRRDRPHVRYESEAESLRPPASR